jgi:biopolymer transport protein ExbB
MNTTSLLCALLVGAATCVSASESLDKAAHTVQQDLESSLKELATLREQIASEKIPMSSELSRLEDRLGALRGDYDKASRLLDTRNLELANLKAEIKGRQDELSYLSNLMDEYTRGFESHVHVSELARYAPIVEAARLAPQNADLTQVEKHGRQFALVKTSLVRIEELVGGARFDGDAVAPDGLLASGKFAIVGPVVLFASNNGQAAGLALPQAGSTKPAVRSLDKSITPGIASIVNSGEGIVPLDPTRGSALKELVNRGSLVGYFKKGGPIMYPLLLVSLIAVTVIIERMIFLSRIRKQRDPKAVEGLLAAVQNGDIEGAIRVGTGSQDFIVRALTYAVTHRGKSLSDALMRAATAELVRFNRSIPFLDTVVTMAPLLGLLGTVTGMMRSFGMLGGAELAAPAAITGGIAEALIATAFGLGIAIACLIPLNFLRSRAEEARHEMEDTASHLELLMKPIMEEEGHVARQSLLERMARRGTLPSPSALAQPAATRGEQN